MKQLLLSFGLIAVGLASVGWVDQTVITGTPTTNATAAAFGAPQPAARLHRVRLTVPPNGTNMTFALAEVNGVSILATNILVAPTNGSFVISWVTNLVHGRLQATTGGAGWTNTISGTTTSAVIPSVTLELLGEK